MRSGLMSGMRTFVEFLMGEDDLAALVMLNGTINGRPAGRTAIGFYRDRQRFLNDAETLNGSGNLYVNLNRLNPDVYGRAADRFQTYSQTRFVDAEIIRRRAILIDCDPKRITGINSTD